MYHTNKLEDMLNEGYSKKYATYYLNILESEQKNPVFDQSYVRWAHSRGFSAESACLYGLNEDNLSDYLSDYDYYKSWPLNDWTRI